MTIEATTTSVLDARTRKSPWKREREHNARLSNGKIIQIPSHYNSTYSHILSISELSPKVHSLHLP